MGRQELQAAGFNPDEQQPLTPEISCGAAVLEVVRRFSGLPSDEASVRDVIEIANSDLINAGLEPSVDRKMLTRVSKVIKSSGLPD